MSVQAMSWALRQQDVTDPKQRHVLLCLANYADEEGRGAWPSVQRLVRDTGLSRSSVMRALVGLQEAGLVRPGDRRLAELYITRKDRLPQVWDVVMDGVSHRHPVEATGCQGDTERGVRVTPDPSEYNHQKTPPAPPGSAWGKCPDKVDPLAWEAWTAYKRGKPAKATITAVGNLLSRYSRDVQRAAVERSIASGWAGLFPEKELPSPKSGTRIEEVMGRLRSKC